MKNGRDKGLEHLQTLEAYLASGSTLPVVPKDGSLNLAELARTTGIPKSSFYQNPKVKQRLETARLESNLIRQGERASLTTNEPSKPDALPTAAEATATKVLERRLHRLEQQNGALVAENYELRRQVKELRLQLGREDMMIDSGRRIVAPPVDA